MRDDAIADSPAINAFTEFGDLARTVCDRHEGKLRNRVVTGGYGDIEEVKRRRP